MNKDRQTIYVDIYYRELRDVGIPYGDLKLPEDIQPNDMVYITTELDEFDAIPVASLVIRRERLETDEEWDKRIEHNRFMEERRKETRFQRYLKLKEEFGNEEGTKVQECKEGNIQI